MAVTRAVAAVLSSGKHPWKERKKGKNTRGLSHKTHRWGRRCRRQPTGGSSGCWSGCRRCQPCTQPTTHKNKRDTNCTHVHIMTHAYTHLVPEVVANVDGARATSQLLEAAHERLRCQGVQEARSGSGGVARCRVRGLRHGTNLLPTRTCTHAHTSAGLLPSLVSRSSTSCMVLLFRPPAPFTAATK